MKNIKKERNIAPLNRFLVFDLSNFLHISIILSDSPQSIISIDIYISVNKSRVFSNGPGDQGSIPGRVIPKCQKMVLDAALLNNLHYKVKYSNPGNEVASSPTPRCSRYRKGSPRVTTVANLYIYIYIYIPYFSLFLSFALSLSLSSLFLLSLYLFLSLSLSIYIYIYIRGRKGKFHRWRTMLILTWFNYMYSRRLVDVQISFWKTSAILKHTYQWIVCVCGLKWTACCEKSVS